VDAPERLSILVADDNPAARTQIVRILEELGHDTTAVGDGAEAVSAMAALRFDLAVLDFEMPGLRGDEVARRAGADGPASIGLSSAGLGRAEWGDAPIAEWLAKPVDARALAEAVRRAAARGQDSVAAAPPVDLTHLATYTDGDAALERELAALFAESCERYAGQMARAEDSHQWRDAAHGLKGAARGIGATEVARLAAFAETLLGRGAEQRRQDVLEQIRAAADDVSAFFARHLQGS
jgi:CheY-like chemotaxis protein